MTKRGAGVRSTLTRRTFLSGSAALVAAHGVAFTSSCAQEGPTPSRSTSGSRALSPFTFLAIVPPNSLTFAPELLADAAGYFADEGLNVTFELTRGSAQALQLILADKAPLTRISQIDGMRAAANRAAPLMNVGTVIKNSTIRYVSSERAPLLGPADFVGKTVGIPSEGGSSDLELDLILAASGIDPQRVARQVVGLAPGVFDLVEQGRIAGYAVSIDTAKLLKQRRSTAVVFNPGELIASGGQMYVTSRNSLTLNREDIAKYLRAVRAAIEFMINDERFDRTLEILREKYSFEALEHTFIAKESLNEYVAAWTSWGRERVLLTDAERWAMGYQELVRAGLVAEGPNAERWFTNELMEPF